MRIGFDASQTGARRAGCGWYARSLLEALAEIDRDDEFVVYPTFGDSYWSANAGADTCLPLRANFRRGVGQASLESLQAFWTEPPPDLERRLGAPDLIHANNFYCPVGLQRARVVYTLYDLSFLDQPDWTTEANRTACFAGVLRASLHADLVIAISRFSGDRFRRHFPYFPAERLAVAPPASRFAAITPGRPPAALGDAGAGGFWLHVGTIEPRKNLEHLCEAFATVAAADPRRRPLVLAGASGWMMESWPRRLAELGIADRVLTLGYVDDATLRWLYENCFALIIPSRYEGFGMPALEAMSLGAPVVAAAATSLVEIVGDAGLLIDPDDPGSTAAAMRQLIDNEERRTRLRESGRERARAYSWSDTARRVLDGYRWAVDNPRR